MDSLGVPDGLSEQEETSLLQGAVVVVVVVVLLPLKQELTSLSVI